MTSSLKTIARQGVVAACAALLLAGVGYVFAAPTAPPPGTTIPLPINTGAAAQTKAGDLTISGRLSATELCLGSNCQTTWPSATVQAGTANATGQTNLSVPQYTQSGYSNTIYYRSNNGQEYQYSTYGYFYNHTFSVTANVSGVPISIVTTPTVRCYVSNSSYTYTPAPATSGWSSDYTKATNVSVSFGANNTVVVTGTCTTPVNYYQVNYFVVPVDVSVRYLY